MTIHITPEPEFSYVSFESNVASANYRDLISRVIKLFQPGKFVVTIFASKVSDIAVFSCFSMFFSGILRLSSNNSKFSNSQTSKKHDAVHELDYEANIGEWKRRDIQYCRFPGYDLTYAHYTKFPSWGLQALARSQANRIPFNRLHPFVLSDPIDKTVAFSADPSAIIAITLPSIPHNWTKQYHVYETIRSDSRRLLIDTKTKDILPVAIDSICLCLYILLRAVQLMRHCVDEHSPLVLFSWWRNKISWDLVHHMLC